MSQWISIGKIAALKEKVLQEISVDGKPVALSFQNGQFGAVAGICPHAGAHLAEGQIRDGHIVCPRHQWTFHCTTGAGKPSNRGCLAQYEVKEENDELLISVTPLVAAKDAQLVQHPLTRKNVRGPGPVRVLGIATTVTNKEFPRISTSNLLLDGALAAARDLGAESKLIDLNELSFRACEGYYSRSAEACTWPCTITQMEPNDQLDRVYEALVFWADVVLIATPIRWGAASSLYFKMAERFNCIQNSKTIHNRALIQNKAAGFIITGGQDNIQAVAGQMMVFFSELGFVFPPNAFVAHSRGWLAEDMENNINAVRQSEILRNDVAALVRRCIDTAKLRLPTSGRDAATPTEEPKASAALSAETVRLAQESWQKLDAIALDAAELFYGNLFAADPGLRPLFGDGNIREQGGKLMSMIGAAVGMLGDLDKLVPILQDLGRRHAKYGVQNHHLFSAGPVLLSTMKQGLGASFTPEHRDAWATVYGLVAKVMTDAATAAQG